MYVTNDNWMGLEKYVPVKTQVRDGHKETKLDRLETLALNYQIIKKNLKYKHRALNCKHRAILYIYNKFILKVFIKGLG